jgi:hypothetical protein
MPTTTTPTYQAVTDPTIKTWHLGSKQRKNKAFCGVELIWPQDTRKVALKVERADRHHEVNTDLSLITCGACKRSNEYKYATGTATRPTPPVPVAGRPSREARAMTDATAPNMTHSDEAAAAADANAEAAAPPSQQAPKPRRRSQSRADKAHAAAERDRLKREAAAAVDGIDAALAANAEANGTTAEPETPAAE